MTKLQREKATRTLSDAAIERVKEIANKQGITMTSLAKESGVPYVNITRMFSGSYGRVIALRTLVALSDALEVNVGLILK